MHVAGFNDGLRAAAIGPAAGWLIPSPGHQRKWVYRPETFRRSAVSPEPAQP